MKVTLYSKPTCSTCQKVTKALQDKGADVNTIEYLKTPPSVSDLDGIAKKLSGDWDAIIRKKEPLYKERFAGKDFSRAEWLKILHENPVLIERPIVVAGDRAIIARPPEKLDQLFK